MTESVLLQAVDNLLANWKESSLYLTLLNKKLNKTVITDFKEQRHFKKRKEEVVF